MLAVLLNLGFAGSGAAEVEPEEEPTPSPAAGGGEAQRRAPFTGRGFFDDIDPEPSVPGDAPEPSERVVEPPGATVFELFGEGADRRRAELARAESLRLIAALEASLEGQDAVIAALEAQLAQIAEDDAIILAAVEHRRKAVIEAALVVQRGRIEELDLVLGEIAQAQGEIAGPVLQRISGYRGRVQ